MWKPGASKPKPAASSAASKKVTPTKTSTPAVASNEPRATAKSALSQKTLAMKFMQRNKRSKEERAKSAQEQQKSDTWVVPEVEVLGDAERLVCTRDVPDPSLPTIFGRRSFGSFNKAVEDEYREASRQDRHAASEERERREEVSAEEMASRMVKYTGLLRGSRATTAGRGKKRLRKE